MDQIHRRRRTFRLHVLLTLVALVLEFILGIYNTLFVEFPQNLDNGNAWGFSMSQSPIILAHVLLGTLMVVMALSTLGFGIAIKDRAALGTSVTGLVMVGVAYLSGAAFLTNVQQNGYSFSMALGFMGAVLAYGAAYYLTRPSGLTAS